MSIENELQMSGTAAGLVAFLDWTSRTGELSSNTATSYKTAVTKVFEIDGESWPSIRVADVKIDNQLDRFARLRASRYNSASLQSYGTRFRASIDHYKRYLENPVDFKTSQPVTGKIKPQDKASGKKPRARIRTGEPGRKDGTITSVSTPTQVSDLVQYPFPLRNGVMAYLSLPRDLGSAEARRIASFVASLAIDPILELPQGPGKDEG